MFLLENLNTAVDHPRTPFANAADTLALVEAVDSPYLRMNLDLYHAQIGEGNLIELIERAGPAIGEIQVADVPGRCEPGTGEIYYPAVAEALRRLGFNGVVGLEGWASGDPDVALTGSGARSRPTRPQDRGARHTTTWTPSHRSCHERLAVRQRGGACQDELAPGMTSGMKLGVAAVRQVRSVRYCARSVLVGAPWSAPAAWP